MDEHLEETFGPIESDPHGKPQHEPGAKLDAGKVRAALVIRGFSRALLEVAKVGTYGAAKYSPDGWLSVPDGIARYEDALMRHHLLGCIEPRDHDTNLLHAAHRAWNALATLELMIRNES